MGDKLRKTAIDIIGDVPWGTHFCQFYQTKEDLIDILVPYFEAGLENNEFCMWITSEPLNSEDAKRALKKKVTNLDDYIKKGQIEILDYTQWYTKTGGFDANEVLQGWIEKEREALEKGFEGLRLTGNTFWLEKKDWQDFTDYEAAVNSAISQYHMLAICTYSLEKCTPSEIIDVVSNHEFALIRRAGKWNIIGSAEYKKTVEALRESEDKYRVIFEQAADSIVLIDAETGDLVEFNDRTHNNLGYTRQEFQKLKISDFEVIESAHEVAKHIKKIVREGADTFETKQRRKSGEIRDILVSSKSISIGGRDFILSIWRDITERKKALEDLQISEANYRTIFDSANDGIFVHDIENGKILSVNQKSCEIFGYAREELERLTVEDISTGIPPYDQEHAVRWIKKAIKKGPQLFEWICKDNTGRSFWAEINLKLAVIQGQERMLAIIRDITNRKETENALRLHELGLESLLELNKMGEASQEEILGFVREEVIKITQSKFAFIGFMTQDESVMTINNWSKETMAQCAVVDKPMQFPIAEAGLWGEVVRQRKTVVVNDYALYRHKKGCPEGHVPIKRFLGIPVFEVNRIVAVAAVANKDNDYNESDIRAITSMMNDMWRLLKSKSAEDALLESEKKLSAVLTSISDGFLTLSRDLVITYFNRAAEELLGRKSKDVTGRHLFNEAFPEAKGSIFEDKYKQALRENEPLAFEAYFPTDPYKNWYDIRIYPYEDGLSVYFRVVSERKEAEEALRESESKHRTLLKNIPQKIFYKDLDSVYMLCNESYADDLKIGSHEIKGKTDYDFYPRELADKYRADDKRIMQSGKTESIEERYVKNGQEGTVHTFKSPVKDEKGNIIGIFGIFWDITERKRMEETLERSEERYALAQRAANIGSWDWDIITGKLVWTEQIEPMFGFGHGEFVATYEAFLECVHPEDRKHVVDSVDACVQEGKNYAIEHRIVWPDGTIHWMSETGDVIRDEGGKAIRMLGIVRDITDRKERESQQQLVELLLERLNQKRPLPELIHDVIKLIKESAGFEAVGVRLHDGEDFPYFVVNGFPKDFVEDENYLFARNEEGEQVFDEEGHPVLSCMCGSVIIGLADPALPFFTDGGSFWTNSTTELQSSASLKTLQVPLRNGCNKAGYESVALIPLRSGDEIVGLLQLNDSRPGRFTLEMIRLFEGIGASIGIGLARIRAEENMHNLAKFPSENPSPVLRISKEGTVLYANAAGSEFLKNWECNVGEQVPEHWYQYVLRILKSGSSEELEAQCGEKVFSLIIAPVVEAGYVNTYGIDITERKLAEEDLRKYRQHLEVLVETRTGELTQANRQLLQEIEARKGLEKEILNVSEQERRKIGQELHDSLGQQLTGIAFMTKVLEQKLANKSLNEAADVAEIAQLVNQATNQARSLAKGLHPIDLDTETLMSTLLDLAESTKTLFGINCTFKCDKRIRVDNPEVAVHLYRITQEAITNAIKHGKAKNIQIDLAYNVNQSVLTVRNDGTDFPKEFEARHTGMGLQIMDHRVDIIEGSLDIHKGPKGGTIMTCTFPIKR